MNMKLKNENALHQLFERNLDWKPGVFEKKQKTILFFTNLAGTLFNLLSKNH